MVRSPKRAMFTVKTKTPLLRASPGAKCARLAEASERQ
jgi:hypothetical protein